MKIIDVEQGSREWAMARLGIPTASEFHRIVTPVKGDLSSQARRYAHQLVAETLMGEPLESMLGNLEWIARGKLMEPHAVQMYEFTTDLATRPVGFMTTDDGRIGASPDRLVLEMPGAVEIKCTAPQTHVGFLIDGVGDDYRPQVQGQLLVSELDWVDFYAYHPTLPPVQIRTHRDEPYISRLRSALDRFLEMRDTMLDEARETGFFDRPRRVA